MSSETRGKHCVRRGPLCIIVEVVSIAGKIASTTSDETRGRIRTRDFVVHSGNDMLSETERRVLDEHTRVASDGTGRFVDGLRVRQWEDASSVYFKGTGRLWVHNDTPRKQAYQELYFHSVHSVCNTLTCGHSIKFWDLRRHATPREHLRIQGFPDTFAAPSTSVVRLVGNAVAVPCAAHACSRIVDAQETIAHVDLCAGIGGFSCAMKRVCPSTRCVGFSEIDSAAIRCFQSNFSDAVALGDAEKVTEWPRCDVITAGFPCQPFSGANSRRRRDAHAKKDFFLTVCEAVKRTEAQRIVLENVQNLLTVGRVRFDEMIRLLEAMGFQTAYAVLNAAHFGVAQKRKRLYIIGRRDGGLIRPLDDYTPMNSRTLSHVLETPEPQ